MGTKEGWESLNTSSDAADLMVEHQIWPTVDPYANNEAFNSSNGDVCRRKRPCPILVEQFNVECAGYEEGQERISLAETMTGKEVVWEEIVSQNKLTTTKLEEVMSWSVLELQ